MKTLIETYQVNKYKSFKMEPLLPVLFYISLDVMRNMLFWEGEHHEGSAPLVSDLHATYETH